MRILIIKSSLSICLFLIIISCNTSKPAIDLDQLRQNYQEITLSGETYLTRKSDIEKLSKLEIICSKAVENGIIPSRRILKRGLEAKYLLKYASEDFYFEYAFTVDQTGRTVLARIVKTNFELSEDEKLDLLIKILQTVVEEGKTDYVCATLITKSKTVK